jgi:large subunit ribosomal protein L21
VIEGAKVVCENLGEFRGPKLIHYRMRRRKASRKKQGHRQDLLRLLVKEIKVG